MRSMAETLPAALEPELRRIIDTAVARVAAIELDAIREARELTQRSEQEAREALRFALDRAFNLINTLELLAATVSGMADALKIELDDAMDALRKVPEPESALARELAQRSPAQEAPAQETPAEEAPVQEAPVVEAPVQEEPVVEAPVQEAPVVETPDPRPEPAPAAAQPPIPEPQPAVVEEAPAEEPARVQETASVDEETPEVPAAGARTSWYPPAERQAESLAAAAAERKQEPQSTVSPARASEDGKPAVPARRRGIMRRLFSK